MPQQNRVNLPDVKDVCYLAFEGGGGKGVTYVGAIRALESLGVLPIDIKKNPASNNQIRGISGASAGAITALLLAMGLTSDKLQAILSHPAEFNAFFDGPNPSLVRVVDRNNKPVVRRNHMGPDEAAFLGGYSGGRSLSRSTGLAFLLAAVQSGVLGATSDPIVSRLIADPSGYLYNLLFDRGLFPGFAPRKFFAAMINAVLNPTMPKVVPGRRIPRGSPGEVIGFEEFFAQTGVDLVITGANVTRNRPALFSRRFTPDFPVAEAVGISMNLPILFKPVRVEADVPAGPLNASSSDYHGEWVDGGLLNNLPLHAFDHLDSPTPGDPSFALPLNPHMLGLRLTPNPTTAHDVAASGFGTLKAHLGNVVDTLMFPSEQGQIRTPQGGEPDHRPLHLRTENHKRFAPPPDKTEKPIKEAELAVHKHFGHVPPAEIPT